MSNIPEDLHEHLAGLLIAIHVLNPDSLSEVEAMIAAIRREGLQAVPECGTHPLKET